GAVFLLDGWQASEVGLST
ncbi:hypothetical protein A2U01_0052054, partial [Trifolium medium]|nr:hypothetical protein [Trifolium medium]